MSQIQATEKKNGQIRIGIVGPRTVGKTTYLATLFGHTPLENLTLTAREEKSLETFRCIWNEIKRGGQAPRNFVGTLPAINFVADLNSLAFGNVEFVDSAGEVFNIGEGLSVNFYSDTTALPGEPSISKSSVEEDSAIADNYQDNSSAAKNYAEYAKYAQTLKDLLETCDAIMLFIEAPNRASISLKSIATHPTLKLFLNSIEDNRTGKIKKPVAIIVAKSDKLLESIDEELDLSELEATSRALFAGQIQEIERMCQTVGVFPISVFRETVKDNSGEITRTRLSPTGVSRPVVFLLNEIEKMHSEMAEQILTCGYNSWEQVDKAADHIAQLAEPATKNRLNELLKTVYGDLKARAIRKIAIFSFCFMVFALVLYEIAWPFYLLHAVLPAKMATLNYEQAILDCDSFLSLPHTSFSIGTVKQAQKNIAEKFIHGLLEKGSLANTPKEVSSATTKILPVYTRFFQNEERFKTDVLKLHERAKTLSQNDELLNLTQLSFTSTTTPDEIKKLQKNIQQIANKFTDPAWHKKIVERENEIILSKITSFLRSKVNSSNATMKDINIIRESWGNLPGIENLLSEVESSLNDRNIAIISSKLSEIEALSDPVQRWSKINDLQSKYSFELSQGSNQSSSFYHVSQRFSTVRDETISIETMKELQSKFGSFNGGNLRLQDYQAIKNAIQECDIWNAEKKKIAKTYLEKVKAWLRNSENNKIEIWLTAIVPELKDTQTDFWGESEEERRIVIKYETTMKIEKSNIYAKMPKRPPEKDSKIEFLFCRIPVDSVPAELNVTVEIEVGDEKLSSGQFKIGKYDLMKVAEYGFLKGKGVGEPFKVKYEPKYDRFDVKIE